MMSATLGIDDDDAVDIVRDLEKSFDIVISDSEAASCRTLGDVFELILKLYRDNGLGGRYCGSAMAFYRVRRGIEFIVPGIKLRPDMLLRDITPVSAKRLFQTVEARTGLRLPSKSNSWIGLSGAVGMIGGSVGAIPAGFLWGTQGLEIASVLIGIGLLMNCIDPGKFPKDCNTIGELSERVAKLNVGHLAKAGAKAGEKELWDTLTEVASRYSSVPIAMMNPNSSKQTCCCVIPGVSLHLVASRHRLVIRRLSSHPRKVTPAPNTHLLMDYGESTAAIISAHRRFLGSPLRCYSSAV